jgi:hypothetical protein
VYYLSRRGTICVFALVKVFILVCSIFLHSPAVQVISPLRELYPSLFSPGYFAVIVLLRTNETIVAIKGTIFPKHQLQQQQL